MMSIRMHQFVGVLFVICGLFASAILEERSDNLLTQNEDWTFEDDQGNIIEGPTGTTEGPSPGGGGPPKRKLGPNQKQQIFVECMPQAAEGCHFKAESAKSAYYCCITLNLLSLLKLTKCNRNIHYPRTVLCDCGMKLCPKCPTCATQKPVPVTTTTITPNPYIPTELPPHSLPSSSQGPQRVIPDPEIITEEPKTTTTQEATTTRSTTTTKTPTKKETTKSPTKPTTKKPPTKKPATKKPATKKPATKTPETKKPVTIVTQAPQKSETEKPETEKPETKKPETEKPETKKPETKKPETKKPVTKKPATKKPATKKPATKKPATKKPATKKPATKKPATKKPATKKPATKKPETKTPETKIPATNKPEENPSKAIKCHSCESTQADSSTDCKDRPKTAKIINCQPGEVCRTLTYVSDARGGSVLIRGCVNPNSNRTYARMTPKECDVNPPYLPKICDDECGVAACACTCNTDLCNNVIYPGQGWNACD